jgi:hypothetical protein
MSKVKQNAQGGVQTIDGHWLDLCTPALSRVVVQELLLNADRFKLDPSLVALLRECVEEVQSQQDAAPRGAARIIDRLKVRVDIKPLTLFATMRDQREKMELACKLLVQRQAHYPLLHKLFGVSRQEIPKLRAQYDITPPNIRFEIPDVEARLIWKDWLQICQDFKDPVDQWVMLATQWPQMPIYSLYELVVVEA